jgi:hypothetical protein
MSRRIAAVALLVLVSTAGAAPTLKEPKQPLYFSTTEGSRRVYVVRYGGNTVERTEVVSKVEKKDGVCRVSLGRDVGGEVHPMTTVEVSDKGIFRVATAGRDLPTPNPLLKLPAKPGDTWEWEQEGPGGAGPMVKTTYTVGKEEEIEVPAGKFKAIPVEAVLDMNGRIMKTTSWYAPGIGPVKTVSDSGTNQQTQVLKSITPAR